MRRDGKFLFMAEYFIKEKTNFTLIELAPAKSRTCPFKQQVS